MGMVERVARALADEARFMYERDPERWNGAAIAAIEDLRELDDETRDAGLKNNFGRYADAAWEAMIDSILKSTRETAPAPARRGEVDEAR
jgi:hypothetical protein